MDAPKANALADFLASVDLFSVFTQDEINRLAASAKSRFLAFGDTVCSTGETASDLLIVKSGSIRVFTDENGKEVSMGVRKAGEVFGEIVMLRESRHESSARASAKTELISIPRDAIAPIVASNPTARAFIAGRVAISSAGGLISQLFDLRGKVDKAELEAFIRSVGVKQAPAGKEILKQDSREDRRLYVVRHGEVRVVRVEDGVEYPLAILRQGDTFGEKACLMRQEQAA
jgi:subfamily B ATP-binding cassette protein HlyB/CyaB